MTRQHLLAAWGLTTTVGWLATAALGAAGIAASALAVEGRGRKALYGVAAALNGLMLVVLVLVPSTQAAAFPIAASTQGLPVLADLPLRDRAHRAVAPSYPVPLPS